MRKQLLASIRSRQARVAVIGQGYVGLPLAVEFARVGFTVTGIDISEGDIDLKVDAGAFTAHGPVKAMILDLDASKAEAMMTPLLNAPSGSVSIRQKLTEFAEAEGLSL